MVRARRWLLSLDPTGNAVLFRFTTTARGYADDVVPHINDHLPTADVNKIAQAAVLQLYARVSKKGAMP